MTEPPATDAELVILAYRCFAAGQQLNQEADRPGSALRSGQDNPLLPGVTVAKEGRNAPVDIVLIAGLWLQESAWGGVGARLAKYGHRPVPVALPGQGDGNTSATLADQVAAVLAAVDSAAGQPMVVGHSAASSLAWLAADARPGKVSKAAFIGGWPAPDGKPYFDGLPVKDGAVPFPGWDEFEDGLRRPGRRRQAGLRGGGYPSSRRGYQRGSRAGRPAPLRRPGGTDLPGVHPRPGRS